VATVGDEEPGGMLRAPGVQEALFANVPSAIAVFSAAGHCVLVNPAYLRLFGSAPPPEYSLFKDELAQRMGLTRFITDALAGQTVTSPVYWYDAKQLQHVTVTRANRVAIECTVFPLPTRGGAVEHLGLSFRDVTAELMARQETAAERDRLRAVIEQSGDGIIVADAAGVIQLRNRAAELQHGGPDLAAAQAPIERALRGERVESTWEVLRPDGARRVLEGTATTLRGEDGVVAGAILISRDVTERRRTEDELRLHSRILDAMAEGVSVTDQDGILRYTNPAQDAMFGYARGELIGMHFDRLTGFPPDENRRFLEALRGELRERREWTGEWARRAKDGTPLVTRAHIVGIRIGGAQHWVCVQADVTAEVRAREQAERLAAELRRSEDHYRATVNLNPQVTWTATPDGVVATVSDRWFALTGADPDRPFAEGWRQALPDDDRAQYDEAWRRAVATGVPLEIEHRVRHAGGELRWMRSRAFARIDDAGRIARWYGTIDDVHDRRVAEAALQDSERHWREIVENLPALAWTARPDGHVDFYNRRWYEYTGTTFEDMQGAGWRLVHEPAMLPQVEERWARSLESGEPFEMEFPLRGADGVYRWFLTRVRPLRGASGRILRWFGTCTNVDEQRRQAAALREAVRARDTFISVASHELNTPLSTLLLRAQALLAALDKRPLAELEGRIARDVDSMRRQALRLSSLIGGMLDVSRIGQGRLTLHLEDADLAELVREMVATFGPEAERQGVALEVCAPEPIPGRWDPTRVGQIVANLLSNALRYGAGKPVRVTLAAEDGDAVLRVVDRGIGIAISAQRRIFEKYERAVSERHYGGLGLGLYVTRELVLAMGGSIQVDSEPDAGSTFVVRLPVRRSPAAPQPEP
jgi:PAS domain S-box-containing protein